MTETADDTDLNRLYTERAHLLALLALHYPAYIAESDRDNPGWPVLTIDTPAGQMAWHLASRDLELFPHVRRADNDEAADAYDGHTTSDKLERIRARIAQYPARVNP